MKTREDILSLAGLDWSTVPNRETDDAHPVNVLAGIWLCASHWVPEARIIGNVRAGDIVRAIDWLAAAPTPPAAEAPGQDPVAVPEFLSIARYKLMALQAAGWRVNGYSLIKEYRRGFIDHGGFVGWWLPEHYPQHTAAPPTPPAAEAPGQEPVARQHRSRVAMMWGGKVIQPIEWGEWSDWREGPAPMSNGDYYQAEERPLYAPPTYADAEKTELRAALAPFTALSKRMLDKDIPRHIQDDESTPVLGSGLTYEDPDAVAVTVGDLRRAAAIRSLASPAPKGET